VAEKKLSVVITGDAKGAQQAFSSVSASASTADSKLSKVGGSIGKVFKTVAVGGAVLGVAAGAFVKGGIDALIEVERIAAQTDAVIRSTGGAADRTAEQVANLAGSLEKMSGVEAEVIQQGQNMLLTFTNIKGTNFDAATQTMLDMSVAMGTDASTTAMQLGRALNDPVKGISALSKVGVTFTDQQKEQIEAMVAVGDTAGAQKVILAELNKEFGGSAEAFGDTTAGKVAKLKNMFGELQEEVAARLIPAVTKVTEWLGDKMPGAIQWVQDKLDELAPTFDAIGDAVGNFATSAAGIADKIRPAFEAIASFVASNPGPAFAAIGAVVALAFGAWAVSAGAAALATLAAAAPIILLVAGVALLAAGLVYAYQNFEGFRNVVDTVVAFVRDVAFPAITDGIQRVWQTIQTVIGVIKAAWQQWGDELLAIASAAWGFIRSSIDNAIRVVQGVIQTVMSLIRGDWSGAWNGMKDILGGIWAQIKNVVSTAVDALKAVMQAAWDALKSLTRTAWEGIKGAISDGINKAVEVVRGLPGKFVAAIGNMATTLYNAGRDLIDGLVRGIRSAIPSISSVLSSVTSMIPEWKGPPSKDRTLLYDNGVLIMDGLLDGLVDGGAIVESYLGAFTEAIPTMAGGKSKGPNRGPSWNKKPTGPGSDHRGPSSGTKEWADLGGLEGIQQGPPVAVVAAAAVTKESAFDLVDVGQILERQLRAQDKLNKMALEAVTQLKLVAGNTKLMTVQLAALNVAVRPAKPAGSPPAARLNSAGAGTAQVTVHVHGHVMSERDLAEVVADGMNKASRMQARPLLAAGVAG
jgi:phage-related protein